MIECESKHVTAILNRGIICELCTKHMKMVNATICSKCPDHNGRGEKLPIEVDFPRRSKEEIEAVHSICNGCPMFDVKTQLCSQMPMEMHPTDIYAQHPSNHCPEKLW